jgi:soluble lytic murein transglycosylase-like protein
VRRKRWIRQALTFGFVLGLVSSCGVIDRGKNYIPSEKVWPKVRKEAGKHGLDPAFVYAICHAESSLDANAETSVARGMMQLTEGAWKDVTDKSYRLAFNWETNVEVGTGYLGKLKGMLGKANVFNYPRLAASYRYGYGALRKQGFLVSKMKTPKNRIYRKIFAGEIRPVKTPTD